MTPAFKALNYTELKTYNQGGSGGHLGFGGTEGLDGQSGPTPVYKVVESIDFEWKPNW